MLGFEGQVARVRVSGFECKGARFRGSGCLNLKVRVSGLRVEMLQSSTFIYSPPCMLVQTSPPSSTHPVVSWMRVQILGFEGGVVGGTREGLSDATSSDAVCRENLLELSES